MVSPWEGRNHRVTMGRWIPQSHHEKVETTESPQKDGNHRVTTERWKPQSQPWEGGNHRVTMRKVETTE